MENRKKNKKYHRAPPKRFARRVAFTPRARAPPFILIANFAENNKVKQQKFQLYMKKKK